MFHTREAKTNIMGVDIQFLSVFCLCIVLVTPSPKNNGTANTQNELQQLEEKVSDLQKHMLAQEQKQTAVLSSVLSELTETKDELAELKTNHTNELAKLQNDFTVLENKFSSLEENCTSSVDDAIKGFAGQEVAFEAFMVKTREGNQGRPFPANSMLLFSSIQHDQSGSWDPSSGVFTATVNGTYQFWIELSVTSVQEVAVSMKRNGQDFGRAFRYLIDPSDTTSVSLTSLTHLVKGDRVYFVADKHVTCWPKYCSCGGVLLHSSGFQ